MAVTPLDPPYPKTPCYMQTSRLSFIETELWAIEVYIAGIGIFLPVLLLDFDLGPMTFIYELEPVSSGDIPDAFYETKRRRANSSRVRENVFIILGGFPDFFRWRVHHAVIFNREICPGMSGGGKCPWEMSGVGFWGPIFKKS